MKEMQGGRQAGRGGKVRRLARLNSRITRLSSELETLHFMQDRLERELAQFSGNAFEAPPLRGKMRGGGAGGRA